MSPQKIEQPQKWWDRLFAPSSSLAIITTTDREGRPNAAAYGTCTRVNHEPVHIAFTANVGSDTACNVADCGEFVANLPRFDRASMEAVRVVGLPFSSGTNELEKAGLTSIASKYVTPPLVLETPRNFECRVLWTKEWAKRLMVVGEVVAASVDTDCVDANGFIYWDKVLPVHYCGAPYGGQFVGMRDVVAADIPYDGPEVAEFLAHERAMFKEP
jgi:flavin reductase (DIM6/NTAB) family NADH-FMN oxidoreductase RutF